MAHTHQCKLGNYEQAGGYKWSFAMVCALKFMQKLSPLMNLEWSKNSGTGYCILAWKVCVLGVQQKKLTGLAVSEVEQPRSSVIYRWGTICMRIWNTGQQNTLIKILMEISICKEANSLFVCLADLQESSYNITRQPCFGLLQNVEWLSEVIMCTYYAFQIIFLSVIIAWNAKLEFHEYFLCLDFRHPVCVDVEHAWKEAFLNMQQCSERICIVQQLWVPQT
jgi:hypothetical protein